MNNQTRQAEHEARKGRRPRAKRPWITLAVACAVLTPIDSREARADQEGWAFLELRIPIQDQKTWLPSHFRSVTDFRFAARHEGLSAAFWRVGPLWDVHRFLFVAAHATASATATAPETLVPEYRLELEPNLRGRFGAFSFNDRNRLEIRWRPTRRWWVYRNQLRLNWHPGGTIPAPFVQNEVMIDLSRGVFDQNRLQLGVGVPLKGGSRLDLAYQLRSRRVPPGPWTNDHVALIGLLLIHGWTDG